MTAELDTSDGSTQPEPAGRQLSDKDLAYDRIRDRWLGHVSDYDNSRRLHVLIDEFLAGSVAGKRCLDAGTGLGFFARRLSEGKPAQLVAVDIGPLLVERLGQLLPGADVRVADMLDLAPALGRETFDAIVCSEAIEHTPDPRRAVLELASRLSPGGLLALSVPSQTWKWSLHLVQAIGLRKHYAGYENWVRPADLLSWLKEAGLTLVRAEGIHTVPWQPLPKAWLRWLDERLRSHNYGIAVNLAVLARRDPT